MELLEVIFHALISPGFSVGFILGAALGSGISYLIFGAIVISIAAFCAGLLGFAGLLLFSDQKGSGE